MALKYALEQPELREALALWLQRKFPESMGKKFTFTVEIIDKDNIQIIIREVVREATSNGEA